MPTLSLILPKKVYENSDNLSTQILTDKFHFSSKKLKNRILFDRAEIPDNEIILKKWISPKFLKVDSNGKMGKGLRYIGVDTIPKYKVLVVGYGLFVNGVDLPQHLNTAMEIKHQRKKWYTLNDYVVSPISYANHSCDPNCKLYTMWMKLDNLEYYDLEKSMYLKVPVLMNKKPIKSGNFLTFDYKWDEDGENCEDDEIEPIKCLCKSKKCRGWLRK